MGHVKDGEGARSRPNHQASMRRTRHSVLVRQAVAPVEHDRASSMGDTSYPRRLRGMAYGDVQRLARLRRHAARVDLARETFTVSDPEGGESCPEPREQRCTN